MTLHNLEALLVQRLLLGLALSVGGTQVALAQTEFLHPVLTVLPQVPSSSDTIQFQILDNTGVQATVDSSSISIQGTTIEIDAQITLGVFNAMLFYKINAQLSALPEGRYTVRYQAQVRQPPPTPNYTAPTLVGLWNLVVLDQGKRVSAIEYYDSHLDHYFITAEAAEINALDSGVFPGWVRTGQTLGVVSASAIGAGFGPVCRLYGLPTAGLDSHFYSASPAECAAVLAKWPTAWILESYNVFQSYLPDLTTGVCPINLLPVYRVYDNRPDANHRYTTSLAIRDQMVNAGWLPEGYGANAVAMCAP